MYVILTVVLSTVACGLKQRAKHIALESDFSPLDLGTVHRVIQRVMVECELSVCYLLQSAEGGRTLAAMGSSST